MSPAVKAPAKASTKASTAKTSATSTTKGSPIAEATEKAAKGNGADKGDPIADATEGAVEGQAEKQAKGPTKKEREAAAAKGRARRRRVKGAVTKGARNPSGSFMGLLVGSAGLILLYDFLSAANQLAGFLGGLQRALAWLSSPTAVIKFKEN